MCKFSTGKYYNCDLDAVYNIGARYFMIDESMPLALFSGYRRCSKVPDERKPDADIESG